MRDHTLHDELLMNYEKFTPYMSLYAIAVFISSACIFAFSSDFFPLCQFPEIASPVGLIISPFLLFHKMWPKPLRVLLRYLLFCSFTYIFAFQFPLLLLLNQEILFLHLVTLISFVLLAMSALLIFIAPISIIGLLGAYLTKICITNSVDMSDSALITGYSSLIIVLIISLFESKRQNFQQMQIRHLQLIAGSIAHELRTPIASLLLGLTHLKNNFQYPSNQQECLDTINRMDLSCKSSNITIDMLLQNLAPKEKINEKPVLLEDCINEAICEYPLTDESEKLISVNISDNPLIAGDKAMLKQVLLNLIKNALYQIQSNNKGTISIRTKRSGDRAFLEFIDTARGIKNDELPYIFEHFYTNSKKGAGLGLAFCKKMVEAHRGEITCNSSYGEHTTFILSFPALNP